MALTKDEVKELMEGVIENLECCDVRTDSPYIDYQRGGLSNIVAILNDHYEITPKDRDVLNHSTEEEEGEERDWGLCGIIEAISDSDGNYDMHKAKRLHIEKNVTPEQLSLAKQYLIRQNLEAMDLEAESCRSFIQNLGIHDKCGYCFAYLEKDCSECPIPPRIQGTKCYNTDTYRAFQMADTIEELLGLHKEFCNLIGFKEVYK